MQFFSTITFTALFVATLALAAPAPAPFPLESGAIYKRTCGTLTGTALTVCQEACKAVCDVATVGIAKTACENACTAGPL
ncbi:hypothetical protein BP5796_12962 [Coleophoma crateriformis]|uniref:Extracellular membrane protein CFEM domain-containing protein n=1 Tax=Coleophoma crateriformis TaxID=565419 RepID=A0A3D8Q4X2_9HELO|nr:hypothetical protein BP5796_12962 [Coleophoma crateriformis]